MACVNRKLKLDFRKDNPIGEPTHDAKKMRENAERWSVVKASNSLANEK